MRPGRMLPRALSPGWHWPSSPSSTWEGCRRGPSIWRSTRSRPSSERFARMAGRDSWFSIAQSASADDLREHILTGFKDGKPFTPYVPTVQLPSELGQVLDFGCGVGRTFPFLKRVAAHVTGFDLPPMIERCRTLAPEPADALFDDWEKVRGQHFDLVVSVLVLQHIEPVACRDYLQ